MIVFINLKVWLAIIIVLLYKNFLDLPFFAYKILTLKSMAS